MPRGRAVLMRRKTIGPLPETMDPYEMGRYNIDRCSGGAGHPWDRSPCKNPPVKYYVPANFEANRLALPSFRCVDHPVSEQGLRTARYVEVTREEIIIWEVMVS